jgi:hypothetical protein
MRIKFLKNAEYPQIKPNGEPDPERSKSYKAGEIYDLPDDHARRWLRRNAAIEVVDEPAHKGKAESLVPGAPGKGHSKSESL